MAINDFFVWGKGGAKLTPDQIERERKIAQSLIDGSNQPVTHWAQGVGNMLDVVGGKLREARADRAQSEGIAGATDAFNNAGIAELLAGGNATVNQPQASSQAATTSSSYQPAGNDVRDGIIATANSLGIDPLDLATAISYETGGTFDPTKSGPTTKWGTHRGLIQFGEPQAKQYGIDWSNPVASQLGENGAVANYLRDTGVKPGMGLLDVYSAINAGGVGRYNRSDTAAGGAPGTVRDKVEQQMAGHRRKAQALLGDGVQVASADPNFMPQASSEVTMSPVAQALTQPAQAVAAPIQQQAMTAPVPQTNRVSEALLAQNDMALGGSLAPSQAVQPRRSAPNLQGLIQLANNPFLNDAQRGMLNTALQYQMQQNDPVRALQMQQIQQGLRKGDLEIAALQAKPTTKYGFTTLPDGTVIRTNDALGTAEPIYEGTPKPTTDVQNYEYAANNPGFAEYQQQLKRAGAQTTNINTGSNSSKFVEESDKSAASRMNDYVVAGGNAVQIMSDMDQLLELGSIIGTGKDAEIKSYLGPYAEMFGIDIENLGEAQAFKSITDRLAPQMRPAGAGSSSDTDVKMYLNSLPNLRNSTDGNTIIANTMRGLAQNKIEAAEIAAKAQSGEITWQEAEKQIRALPNPYENFKRFQRDKKLKGNKTKSGVTWSVN